MAVALGLADLAIGTDTAGSGRVPAGLQGIVGIKPTLGVVSHRRRRARVRVLRLRDDLRARPARWPSRAMAVLGRRRAGPSLAGGRPAGRAAAAAGGGAARAARASTPTGAAAFGAAVARAGRSAAPRSWRSISTPFLAAARLLYDGALVAERYAAVGEFVDSRPGAVDPTVRAIVSPAGGIQAHRLIADRRRLRAAARRGDGAVGRHRRAADPHRS